MIKAVILDYGGTLDTPGIHWKYILRHAWLHALETEDLSSHLLDNDLFYAAYVYGERTLGNTYLIQPTHNFFDTLLIKAKLQLQHLQASSPYWQAIQTELAGKLVNHVATYGYGIAKSNIENNKPFLERLKATAPVALVSNFYGNLNAVLNDFGISNHFTYIIESAAVGIRKPDPRIFQLAIDRLGYDPSSILVVGDSMKNDIQPAMSLGCQCAWLKGNEHETENKELQTGIIAIEALSDIFPI